MYIYELPFNINKELCRLLDHDEKWKDLAGYYMKYKPFEIIEIEQTSRRQGSSPTSQLLTKWGQMNHSVDELFILLYKMEQVPAMYCIQNLVAERLKPFLTRRRNGGQDRQPFAAKRPAPQSTGSSSVPVPVMLLEQGVHQPSMSNGCDLPTDVSSSVASSSNTKDSTNSKLIRDLPAIHQLKYEELLKATDNWSSSNLLGEGGFGKVYKGEWTLLTVAVKRLEKNEGHKELIHEMCLNQYRHDNILPLYGYSINGPLPCLVYQLMSGGSLEQRLRCKTQHPPLSWTQRHRIALGVARGLVFLHTVSSSPLIHGDIKPANILLDQCTIPKIGDFGLARKGSSDKSHLKVSRVNGTRPYLPEEYLRSGSLSEAVDVFSYGVVLAEIATGLRALLKVRTNQQEELKLSDHIRDLAASKVDFATVEDPTIRNTQYSNAQLCKEFINIGLQCTAYSRRDRPTMLQVFKALDAIHFVGRDS